MKFRSSSIVHYDLLLVIFLSVIAVPLIITTSILFPRILLGTALILFFPGFVVTQLLFQGSTIVNGSEKFGVSIALSILVSFVLGSLLNFLPIGITLISVTLSNSVFTIVVGLIAYAGRKRVDAQSLATNSMDKYIKFWQAESIIGKSMIIVLAFLILFLSSTLFYFISHSESNEAYTEFYIINPSGKANQYPKEVKPGEQLDLTVGVINGEGVEQSYTIKCQLDGNPEFEIERFSLGPGEKWEEQVTVLVNNVGEQKLQLVLYKNGSASPYRSVHLWIDVTK